MGTAMTQPRFIGWQQKAHFLLQEMTADVTLVAFPGLSYEEVPPEAMVELESILRGAVISMSQVLLDTKRGG